MKALITLLRPVGLLRMILFSSDGFGENLLVDQVEIPAHAPQIADGGSQGSFERSAFLDDDVSTDLDRPISVVNSIAPRDAGGVCFGKPLVELAATL
jgi:hypothetical protein